MWVLDFLVQHYSNAPSFKHSDVDEFVGSAFFATSAFCFSLKASFYNVTADVAF